MNVNTSWRFGHAVTSGGSERETWYCRDCSRKVVCTSLRGKRSNKELTGPCRCQKKNKPSAASKTKKSV